MYETFFLFSDSSGHGDVPVGSERGQSTESKISKTKFFPTKENNTNFQKTMAIDPGQDRD